MVDKSEDIYIGELSKDFLYKKVMSMARLLLKASDTEEQKNQKIEGWLCDEIAKQYASSPTVVKNKLRPIINGDMIKAELDHKFEVIEPINLYTYVLIEGICVQPWNWLYDDLYYNPEVKITYYYNYKEKNYHFHIGELTVNPTRPKRIIDINGVLNDED